MAVTIKRIAQESGFSPSTVSHAISGRNPGKRSLSADTIAKIKEVAEQLGYRPNLLAAGLSQRKTYTIGVLVALLRGGFYERILEGVTEVVCPIFSPLLAVHGYDREREKQEIDFFIGKRVDGVIAACSGNEDVLPAYKALFSPYSVPLVLVDRGLKGLDCPVVRGDHEKTAYLAVRELIKLGHKKILYATAEVMIESTELFTSGYNLAMAEAGLAPVIAHCELLVPDKEMNKRLAAQIISRVRDGGVEAPTAIICQADWLAYEVLAACEVQGLKVPGDVSVMGLQDCDTCLLPTVSLSVVGIPLVEVGKAAAGLMLKLIRGEEVENKPKLIEPQVIMRRTTRAL